MGPGSPKPPVQHGAQQSCSVPSLMSHPHTGNQCECSALPLAIRRIFRADNGFFLPMLPGYRWLLPKAQLASKSCFAACVPPARLEEAVAVVAQHHIA